MEPVDTAIPPRQLNESDIQRSLRLIIYDGLATEMMNTLVGTAFLVSMSVLLGASNFQIGVLAALPTFTNIFQLLSVWLVQRYRSRRMVSVCCSILARAPLLLIGIILLFFSFSFNTILVFLFIYYLFASIAGPSWNSWMKDLVPPQLLGTYFARRSGYAQALNVVLSIGLALFIDYVKKTSPDRELHTYAIFFIIAGIAGITGAIILSRAKEPPSLLARENILRMLKRPLQHANFRRLLIFNSVWLFALNLATPFFTVFLLSSLGLPLLYVIMFTALSQVAGIFALRVWGRYADRYSNKTIIAICAPLYIICLVAWCFVGIYTNMINNLFLLGAIYLFSGVATAGINLSLINIGLKLAPDADSIVYLSAKNIVTSAFAAFAPLIGGGVADYFAQRSLHLRATWSGPASEKTFRLLELHDFNFLFAIAALLAFISLELLVRVKEEGEVHKDEVVRVMRSTLKNNLKDTFIIGNLIDWHEQFWGFFRRRKNKRYDSPGEEAPRKRQPANDDR